MSSDPWPDESQAESPHPINAAPSPKRVWLERFGIGIIAVISILIPLIFGVLFFLALTDGIVVNAGDPLREVRLWMIQERTGATGIGLTATTPRTGASAIQCAVTSVAFLKWDRRLRIETDASYCRCYEIKNSQLVETSSVDCKP